MSASDLSAARATWLRLAGVALVTLAIVAVAVVAGVWQLSRHQDRAEALQAYQRAETVAPTPLSDLVVASTPVLSTEDYWRVVTTSGVFPSQEPTVLRNRPVDGVVAQHRLAWFRTDDGDSLLVNVGWSAQDESTDAVAVTLPRGPVSLTVVLREWEDDDGRRDAGATRINPAQVPTAPTDTVVNGYGMLRYDCEAPCYAPAALNEVPIPYLSTGPHLSYAWQWWIFAALAPAGAVVLVRRDLAEQSSVPVAASQQRSPVRGPREPSDEEIEDAL